VEHILKTTDLAKPLLVQWPTLIVCSLCYSGFALSTLYADTFGVLAAGILLTLALTLFSSFSHEVLHGHPFRNETLNTLLVFPALGLLIPYPRFRDTHLAHHYDPSLTDPYDDPETNYVDPAVWVTWSPLRRAVYQLNNTLFGRMVLGPFIGLATFYTQDIKAVLAGNRRILDAYLFHFAGLIPVFWWLLSISTLPLWVYLLAVYASHAILKIRTFLEHCAHEKARCRSVIIEDRGVLSLLFLNNNLHSVHHASPTVPWYRLPRLYAEKRAAYLKRNGGYAFRSYGQVIGLFFFRIKDPVPHALMPIPPVPQLDAAPHPEPIRQAETLLP